ncbi:GIP, partial [Symbiodinium necroappetens]
MRKWRQWVQAKMYTMEKLTAKQQGPFLYTLLDGKALEAVEHLELSSIQVDDGADKILKILQERFPEKEAHDQMGEALGEVFGLAAREGETVQQWTARVAEVFTKCHRKADVKFPSPAQGWIALNCAGFSEEQKAIIKAKAQGKLDLEAVTSAMRSCFPLYKAGARARKPTATLVVEPAENPDSGDGLDDFADVEAFLADHNQRDTELEDAIPEDEAAEALAASWKERRAEIAKMRKERKFDSAQNSKKSFRVEIEELKRRAVEAQLVEQEVSLAQVDAVESVDVPEVMFVGMAQQAETQVLAAGLVSSPGYGVVDSGCGRTLIGMDTLEQLKNKLALVTAKKAEHYDTVSSFRFGNGATEVSEQAVKIPVGIGGVHGIIDAAIIKGRAPLLLGRPTLEKLRVSLDFAEKTMKFLRDQTTVPMQVNEAGQLLINVLDFPKGASQASVLQAQAQATQLCPDSVCHEQLSQCLTPPVSVAELFSPPCLTREALQKLHNNLGLALQRVSALECSVCANQRWKPRQKVPCVNVVDFATSMQVFVPLTRVETGNYCNNAGIDMRHTAADAHWQLGKVERHGQWLCRITQRVLDEIRPASEEEWLECLSQAQSAKNTLLTEAGASPYQLVFGRNPRVPSDLMQDSPHLPAVDAEQYDSLLERTAATRTAARKAVLDCQSDRALRAALRARPRALRPFRSGDWVFYWRTQKQVDGVRLDGGRWYGAGLVLGSVGRNLVVAHRRSLLRCSPEQLRFATPSETTVAEFPESELLGIKTLLEKGQFPKSQFVDVTQEGRPPEALAEVLVSNLCLACLGETMAPKQRVRDATSSTTSVSLERLMGRLQAEGRTDEVLNVLEEAFGTLDHPQAMTDASKRRLDDSDFSDFELADFHCSQAPVAPTSAPYPTQFPEGVTSLAQWGQTLCTLPKVVSLKLSYTELVELSKSDREIHSYLNVFILSFTGNSAKVKDLQKYLVASGYKVPATYYEGSKEVRVFKDLK